MKILVVEDDALSRNLLVKYLGAKGFDVTAAADGSSALESAAASEPDLVLLDVNLPVTDGWAVLEALRRFSRTPVIMVTARDSAQDKVTGLDLGADDYITKPFDLRELEARIHAVRRRYQIGRRQPDALIRTDEVVIDDERKEVLVRGAAVSLSPKEYDLLRLLASRPGRVFSTEEILTAVWPEREAGAAEDVKKYVHMLRGKIEHDPAAPRIIVTARGFGYRLASQASGADQRR